MIERYSRPEFAGIWSDSNRFETWLQVELAVCRAMEEQELVPAGSADTVAQKCVGKLSPARILEIEATTRHDVIAFLTHVEELAGPPARWLHLGMTSSDVLDTSMALLCKAAMEQVIHGVEDLLVALKERAFQERDTVGIGRSHGIHAEPITAMLFRREICRQSGGCTLHPKKLALRSSLSFWGPSGSTSMFTKQRAP